uniref:U103-Liphistoxin-Lsp1a_1 n=1 Tax=Liphistius sp. SGP-2016 TaxID=1905180 RepID=A0A4Q8K5K8_9ARAC
MAKICVVLWTFVAAGAAQSTRQEKRPDCRRPPDTGPCRGHLERFYYDPWSERCERFQYGGCRGNRNNFRSFRECMATCSER